MTPSMREQMRLSLLRYAASPISLSLAVSYLRAEGFNIRDRDVVQAELIYLEDKRLLAKVPKTISPELEQWRVTADGRDFLATSGHENDGAN